MSIKTTGVSFLVPRLQMPVFFLLPRNDHFVPAETSVAYFNALTAPARRL